MHVYVSQSREAIAFMVCALCRGGIVLRIITDGWPYHELISYLPNYGTATNNEWQLKLIHGYEVMLNSSFSAMSRFVWTFVSSPAIVGSLKAGPGTEFRVRTYPPQSCICITVESCNTICDNITIILRFSLARKFVCLISPHYITWNSRLFFCWANL